MIIVAMKGHPGTGKTTLARAISASLKLPLLDKDDIKDHTIHLQTQHNLPSSSLNELSYSVLFQITRTQLSLGLSLVLDSPLSRSTLLDSLVQMSKEYGAQVVVVECKPRDEEEWRRRLEERGKTTNCESGHKPSTWQEMEKLLDEYNGCWDYDVDDFVSKIVVDTTTKEHDASDVAKMVVQFIKSEVGVSFV